MRRRGYPTAVALKDTWDDGAPAPVEPGKSTRIGVAPPPTIDSPADTVIRLGPGVRLPGTPYRIRGWLGDGAMGVVYRAEHVDLERRVALKILRPEVSHSLAIADMLRKEAKNASRIGSEYITEVYDLGELSDGRVWFSMPLLEGDGLERVIDDGPMEPGRVIGILRQVCKGLAAAHDVDIIHRDVKPGNIMIVRDRGRADAVRMLDWGIAVIAAEAQAGSGATAGTPYYIAPELVAKVPYDHRVDLYSVGCTAFQMLSGRPPFEGDDLAAVLLSQLEEQAPRLKSVAPDVPEPLSRLVAKCLNKKPDERFADAADLEAALCEAQIEAKLTTPWDDLPLPDVEPARRAALASAMPTLDDTGPRRWLWPAFAGAVTSLAIAGLIYAFTAKPSEAQLAEIDAIAVDARAAAAKSFFLYPPADDPDLDTAYELIGRLEAMTGKSAGAAKERATQLREEFADTLVRLGDKYWDRDGGRAFAVDYYAEAIVFDPDRAHARERAALTPGELAQLRTKAEAADFSASELQAVQTLAILAEEDPQYRAERLIALSEGEVGALTAQRLDQLVEADPEVTEETKHRARRKRKSEPEPPAPARDAPEVGVDEAAETPTDDAETELTPEDAAALEAGVDAPPVPSGATRDRAAAKARTAAGEQAMARGALAEAEKEFKAAVAADNRYARAHHGLMRLDFHDGSYAAAASHGEKATRLAPRNGKYRIELGDAYYKAYRYDDARKQYEAASKLGHAAAAGRLKKVAGQSD